MQEHNTVWGAPEPDNKFPHVKFAVNRENAEEGVQKVLRQVFPAINSGPIELKQFIEGNTNLLFRARFSIPDKDGNGEVKLQVLCRIFGPGTEEIIDRGGEIRVLKYFTTQGYSPRLYSTFENGIIYEFLPGITVTNEEMRDPLISRWIGEAIGRFHQRTLPDEKTAQIWPMVRKWLAKAQSTQNVVSKEEMQKLAKEADFLISTLSTLYASSNLVTLVCCHNDLTADNILLEKTSDTDGKVYFIDMEYCNCNYNAFELGNYFCEWAGLKTEWDYYPKPEQQNLVVQAYLTTWLKREPTEQEIEEMRVGANRFALVSHFQWGVWGLFQAAQNPNGISPNGFSYIEYAKSRLGEYWKQRDNFLNLNGKV